MKTIEFQQLVNGKWTLFCYLIEAAKDRVLSPHDSATEHWEWAATLIKISPEQYRIVEFEELKNEILP